METSTSEQPERIGKKSDFEANPDESDDRTCPSSISELKGSKNKTQTKTYPKRERKPKLFDDFESDVGENLDQDKKNLVGNLKHSGRRGRPPKVVKDADFEDDVEKEGKSKDGAVKSNEKKKGKRGRPPKVVKDVDDDEVEKGEKSNDSSDYQSNDKKKGRRGRPQKVVKYADSEDDIEMEDKHNDNVDTPNEKKKGRRGRPPKVVKDVDEDDVEKDEDCEDNVDYEPNKKKKGRGGRPPNVVKDVDSEDDVEKEETSKDVADKPNEKKKGKRGRPPKVFKDIESEPEDNSDEEEDFDEFTVNKLNEKKKGRKGRLPNQIKPDNESSVDNEVQAHDLSLQEDGKEKRRKRKPIKYIDEEYDVPAEEKLNSQGHQLNDVAKGKRGRPRTKNIDNENIGEKLATSQNESDRKEKCKRGRKRKCVDTENDSNMSKDTEDTLEILPPSKKRRRGRPKTYVEDEDFSDCIDDEMKVNASEHPVDGKEKRKRGRPRKYADSEMDLESIEDETLEQKDVSNGATVTSGRKPRRSEEDTDTVTAEGSGKNETDVGKKTPGGRGRPGRKRKVVDLAAEDDLTEEDDPEFTERKQKIKIVHQCPKCELTDTGTSAMQKHVAIVHQLWWSLEEPEGTERYGGLVKVLKIRKYFNCSKCEKRLNHVQYYQKHTEWCGREDETYSCEKCGRSNLMAMWKELHWKSCPAMLGELKEKRQAELAEKRANGENDTIEEEEAGGSRVKRKAATKARKMVLNLSKNDEVLGQSDGSDSDADVDLEKDGQEEDETDEDLDDELDEEEEFDDDMHEDLVEADTDMKPKRKRTGRVGDGTRSLKGDVAHFKRYHYVYERMLRWMEKQWSKALFPEWLPRKQDWHIQSISESEVYLPKQTESVAFTFRKNRKCESLALYQSTIIKELCDGENPVQAIIQDRSTASWCGFVFSMDPGRPVFYTGLSVWRLAWCPMPTHCSDDQYLAVVGKTDPQSPFLCNQANAGPGIIQVWNTRVTDNSCTVKDDQLPKLCYSVVHDYGMASEIIWCPTGCYQAKDDQTDPESWRRLGLLAVAFTDGTVRIFSMPKLPAPSDGDPAPTYRASPVVSLVPYRTLKEVKVACTCVDWIKSNDHSKIIAGYSDGSIRLFHLTTRSPWLLADSENGRVLYPSLSFRPYGTVIHSVRWCFSQENLIAVATDDFDTLFLDLRSPMSFKFEDAGAFMGMNMASSLWNPGVYIAADDNYAPGTNRLRYVECSSILYAKDSMVRKNEVNSLNIAAQSACAWEVTCSDWLSYVVSCDNKGNLNGMAMVYFVKFIPDCKVYQYRQALLKTTVCQQEDGNDTTEPADGDVEDKTEMPDGDVGDSEVSPPICTCSKEEDQDIQNCAKCRINQSELLTQNKSSQNSQSDHPVLENTSSNNGPDARPVSGTSQTSSQSEDVLQNSADKGDNDIKVETSDKGDKDIKVEISDVPECSTELSQGSQTDNRKFESMKQTTYIRYQEMFDVSTRGDVQDKVNDVYDRYPIGAFKSVQFNPNHLQCCWLAYGGDAGIVRLNTVYDIIPVKSRSAIRKYCKRLL